MGSGISRQGVLLAAEKKMRVKDVESFTRIKRAGVHFLTLLPRGGNKDHTV